MFSGFTVSTNAFPIAIPNLQIWVDSIVSIGSPGTGTLGSAFDRSSNKRALTISGADATAGKFKSGTVPGITFGTTGDAITYTDISLGTSYSFFMTVKVSNSGGCIFYSSGLGGITTFSGTSPNITYSIQDGVGGGSGTTHLTTGQICTLGFVTTADNCTFYLNGTSDGTAAMGNSQAVDTDTIGDLASANNVSIAECMAWNRAITANEISRLHAYSVNRWFDNG